MAYIPQELKYTRTHEWVKIEEDGNISVGITDHAQYLLGDLVYVDLPEVESEVTAGEDVAVIESVKAASDLYAPVSGKILEINEALTDTPESLNTAPYNNWIFKMAPNAKEDIKNLLDPKAYAAQISGN